MRYPLHLSLPALLCAAPLFAGLPPHLPVGLLPSADHRPEVPQPVLGQRYTSHEALMAYVRALAAAAPERVRLSTLNVSEEGREQPFLVITSPENLRRLEEWKALHAKLADPRTCTEAEAKRIADESPVFVWLGYSVHGSEAAGSEAAQAVAYHFAAARSPEVQKQLERVVILMDLTQNPDGRARHLQGVAEATTPFAVSDPLDAQNVAQWPGGRFNHRLFDLNRDWSWQTQGETRAKTAALLQWNPQVVVDLHEMWPEASYYFPPTMQPIHEALPEAFAGRWQATFGQGVARAFDGRGWSYFSRDVFDLFYPGYGDSWPTFQGAVGMTFEAGGQGGTAYRRQSGEVVTLEDRIQRHTTASLATVATAARERHALLWDFHQAKQAQVSLGEKAGAFLLAQGQDPARTRALVALLVQNGIEVQRTTANLATTGLDPIGLATLGLTPKQGLPAGSYLVALDQPRGALAQALLEGEARMGPKPTYDTTAWSLPLACHVPAWRAKLRPRVGTEPLGATPLNPTPAPLAEAAWGYLLPGGSEGTERSLATLLREGFRASALAEPAQFQGQTLEAGTIILPLATNPPGLKARLEALRALHQHPVLATDTGQMTTGPDLGSNRTLTLKAPRLAVLMDRPAHATSYGALAHTLIEAGLPFVQLRADRLGGATLKDFTHLVLVDDGAQGRNWQQVLGEGGAARLKGWLAEGGTLLAFEGGAAYASRAGLTTTGFHLLAKTAEEARLKEKDPKREAPKAEPEGLVRPWDKRDERNLEESIPGAFLKVRVDGSHPLAWGLHAEQGAAVLLTNDPVLELSAGGENPLYFAKENLKVSGLVPRAMEAKLQLSAYALREHAGRGALILVAGDPVFRAQTPFTRRLLFNAIFFGAYHPDQEH